jgi:hypothetical protein
MLSSRFLAVGGHSWMNSNSSSITTRGLALRWTDLRPLGPRNHNGQGVSARKGDDQVNDPQILVYPPSPYFHRVFA